MAKKKPVRILVKGTASLYRDIRSVLETARAGAYRAVNQAMVQAYWHVGRLIVDYEQKGRRRANYGEEVISSLAERLTRDFGRGFDERNLWYMRSFFLAFPILNALRSESIESKKRDILRLDFDERSIHHTVRDGLISTKSSRQTPLRPELSWTHYRLLLGVEDVNAREWYMNASFLLI